MEDWVESLGVQEEADALNALLNGPSTIPADAPVQLHAAILACLYDDRPRAIRLNGALQRIAQKRGDALARAWAYRSQGHIDHVTGDYERAIQDYRAAADLFEEEGMDVEVGRSLSSGIQALIFRGQYGEAEQWAFKAEFIFRSHKDWLRLARLESNVGNIYFRQDRPAEAFKHYKTALEGFETAGSPRDIASALSNLAVCSINLGQFSNALQFYEKTRDYCNQHGLSNLAARADYNIAYLHYLRADYAEARKLYRISRERSRAAGDAYHAALCDLDEAEMYLELNLTSEGELMARRAAKNFGRLAMPYERAKALVNLAVAASQRRDYAFASKTLAEARALFVREKNPIWPALVDQLRAVLAFHDLRFDKARSLSASAWRVLTRTAMPGRAAQCQILLARLWMRAGYPGRARVFSRAAMRKAGTDISPSLRFHANLVQGEIHEREGNRVQAMEAFEAARRDIEDLRERVDTEDLRISILHDKLAVYEGLVALYMESYASGDHGAAVQAIKLVEQAKSRALVDRLGAENRGQAPAQDEAALGELRRDLNWIYRQIHFAGREDTGANKSAEILRQKARDLEARIVDFKGSTPQLSTSLPEPAEPMGLAALQAPLREGELLLEYYQARGTLYVFLMGNTEFDAVRLGPANQVYLLVKLLRFQLGRFRWAKDLNRLSSSDSGATFHHFRELYRLLLAPVEDRIGRYRHLIFAPHKDLHALPFAALHDGNGPLIDRFTVSAVPSAGVLARCRRRRAGESSGALVIAVPDRRAPRIEEEAHLITEYLPGAKLLLGREASLDAVRKYAPKARVVHFAAHGVFRRDNPIFSALQLADSWLSILDLPGIQLNAELLTLSACNTGSAVVTGGDELLGLMRGFLEAGAGSILVTLWDIDDVSTHDFMRHFYGLVSSGRPLAAALQESIQQLRLQYPHPYYWSPFLLVGDPEALAHRG